VQGLANAPVVGPVIREHMKSLPGLKAARVNNTIKMDCGKVVDTVDIEVKKECLPGIYLSLCREKSNFSL
jgi:hypothetical protein